MALDEKDLRELLISMFDYGELLRFLQSCPRGPQIVTRLPVMRASIEDIAAEAVGLLVREGVVDEGLFQRLIESRPLRKADIVRIWQRWHDHERSHGQPAKEVATPPDAIRQILEPRLNVRASVGSTQLTDVLVVTALSDELNAVLETGERFGGVWSSERDSWGFPYHRAKVTSSRGRQLTVAACQGSEMGETASATTSTRLICELSEHRTPVRCLAMAGICAGRRGAVNLGDIVIADRLLKFDNGKIEVIKKQPEGINEIDETTVFHDVKTFNLRPHWRTEVERFAARWHTGRCPPRPRALREQRRWLLEAALESEIQGGVRVIDRPDRVDQCPSWTRLVNDLEKCGELALSPDLALTARGRESAQKEKLLHPDGWPSRPVSPVVHIGAMGTNARVQKDADLFNRLQLILRTILAVEMEGAAVGSVAEAAGIPCFVAKSVVDFADSEKDDSFRAYSCAISADFVISFLLESEVLHN